MLKVLYANSESAQLAFAENGADSKNLSLNVCSCFKANVASTLLSFLLSYSIIVAHARRIR